MNTLQKYYRYLPIFLLGVAFSVALAASNYTLSDAQVYHVRYLVEIRNGNQPVLDYSLRFPLFLTRDLPPYQRLVSFQIKPPQIELVQNRDALNASLTFKRLEPGRSARFEIGYTFVNYSINYDPPSIAGGSTDNPEYLQAEEGIECNSPQIKALAGKITATATTTMEKAKQIFAYVNSNLRYTTSSDEPHNALRTLKRGWGSCEDYSLVYIALCRAVKIPARYVSGFRFSPREIRNREVDLEPYAHAWTEVKLPGAGWVTVDPTYTYTVNNVKKVNYDFFGRILNDDRHLFFSYFRQQERTVSWNYESAHPAKVATELHIFIRKE